MTLSGGLARGIGYAVGATLALTVTACGGDTETPAAPSTPTTATSSATSATPSTSTGSATSATTPPSAKTPTTPPPAKDPTPAGRTITITVKGKKVTPAPSTVDLKKGETLTLVVTSDHDDEIHAHGFEVEGELKAGVPSTITVTGRQAGLFEVETHEPPLRLLMIAVR
jgi:plastocyanin